MQAHVFGFPFWIYVDSENAPETVVIESGVGKIRVYPPFRSAPGNFSPLPKIDPRAIPGWKFKGADIGHRILLPALGVNEKGLQSSYVVESETFDHLPQDNFPMDSLRIDFLDPEADVVSRTSFVKCLLDNVRWMTGQWWINRSVEGLVGHRSGVLFPINSNGAPQGAPGTVLTGGTEFLLFEKPLTKPVWIECLSLASRESRPPIYEELYLDAAHHYSTQDFHLSVLSLSSASENAKNLTYMRLWSQVHPGAEYHRDKVQGNWSLPRHISTRLKHNFGVSYEDLFPVCWGLISELWEARGNVAHGEACVYGCPPAKVDVYKLKEFFMATRHCINWLMNL